MNTPITSTPKTDALVKAKADNGTDHWTHDDAVEFIKHARELEIKLETKAAEYGRETDARLLVISQLSKELESVLGSPSLRVSAEIAKARQAEIDQLRKLADGLMLAGLDLLNHGVAVPNHMGESEQYQAHPEWMEQAIDAYKEHTK